MFYRCVFKPGMEFCVQDVRRKCYFTNLYTYTVDVYMMYPNRMCGYYFGS